MPPRPPKRRRQVGGLDQKNSPSRFRFRPPAPLTFPFRVLPPEPASSYSRSVLGASSTLTCATRRSRGLKKARSQIATFSFSNTGAANRAVWKGLKRRSPATWAGPKKFAEPVSLSSTVSADLPLPGTAFGLGFDLLALRARRKQHTNVRNTSVKGSEKGVPANCGNFCFQHVHSQSSNLWKRCGKGI